MKAFRRSLRASALATSLMFLAHEAHAAATTMPWETPINTVGNSITGPVLKVVVSLLVVGSGIAMANSSSAGVQSFARLLFGASTAGAVALFLGFFNIGSGALI